MGALPSVITRILLNMAGVGELPLDQSFYFSRWIRTRPVATDIPLYFPRILYSIAFVRSSISLPGIPFSSQRFTHESQTGGMSGKMFLVTSSMLGWTIFMPPFLVLLSPRQNISPQRPSKRLQFH